MHQQSENIASYFDIFSTKRTLWQYAIKK